MSLSVLLPVFNGEEYIATAIQSILDQSYYDYELIVIEDGSTDSTYDIISQFIDKRIKIIRNHVNRGLVYSLNKAINQSSGEFIARMDADDVSETDRLYLQLDKLKQCNDLGVISCGYSTFTNWGVDKRTTGLPESDEAIRRNLYCKTHVFCHPAAMIRRESLTGSGGYRQSWFPVEDRDLWFRILERWRGANLPLVLHHKRNHASSITASNLNRQNHLALLSSIDALERKNFPEGTSSETLTTSWVRGHLFVAFGMAFQGDKESAEKHINLASDIDNASVRDNFQELLQDRIEAYIHLGNADTTGAKRALNTIVDILELNGLDFIRQTMARDAHIHLVAAFRHGQLGNWQSAQKEAFRALLKNANNFSNMGLVKIALGREIKIV